MNPSLEKEDEIIQEWVRQSQQGNEEAFAKIVRTYAKRLQSMIYRMVLDWDEARDISQETFIQSYRALPSYQPSGKFQSWLFQIGARRAIDCLRKRTRRFQCLISPKKGEGELHETGKEDLSAQRNELIQAIERAVAQLPPEQRTAFVLSEYEGCSHREIAEIMGGSPKRVEMHVYRARQSLRLQLKQHLPFS